MRYKEDKDLDFLQFCSHEDLRQLADVLTLKDGQRRALEKLTSEESYKQNEGDLTKAWKTIAAYLQYCGSDDIVTMLRRGEGVFYDEVVRDVGNRLKADLKSTDNILEMESRILAKVIEQAIEKMTDDERAAFMKELQEDGARGRIERASHYLGAVGRTREILGNRAVAAENSDLLVLALGQLGQERHSLVSLVDSLIGSLDRLPEAHLTPTLEFIHSSLDIIPKAVFLESQAAFRLEKFHFGVEVLENTRTWHESTISNYRDWGQEQLRAMVIGKPSEAGRALAMLRNEAKMVIDAEENQLLLKHSV